MRAARRTSGPAQPHGVPKVLTTDITRDLRQWLAALGAQTLYIAPGSPWEDGYCESFNGKLREECLNGELFYSLKEAQIVIEQQWRVHYNTRGRISRWATGRRRRKPITPSSLLTQFHSPWL